MVINENLVTKVHKSYEVAVCGGGFAGISAALAAARQGKKTVLFEKLYMLGGLGTAGIVTIYLPLCDGKGRQVSFGIAEELFRLSVSLGAEDKYPENWLDGVGERNEKTQRYEVRFNPQIFAVLAEKLLEEAGVDIVYGTYVTATQVNNGKITHLITENKSGRLAYAVNSVVDATGDCDIAYLCGAPTVNFNQGNILAAWYYSTGKDGYNLHMLGFADIPDEEKTDETRKEDKQMRFSGLDGDEISLYTALSHKSTLSDVIKKRANDPTYWPVTMATTPQLRMTRRIVGEYELSVKEKHTRFESSIGMISNWKERGPVYEVPFEILYNRKVKNLITAGRCVSVNEPMWDIMRVIPCCAVTGQAAGTAAAMTDDFTSLDIKKLQNILQKWGVILHEDEL